MTAGLPFIWWLPRLLLHPDQPLPLLYSVYIWLSGPRSKIFRAPALMMTAGLLTKLPPMLEKPLQLEPFQYVWYTWLSPPTVKTLRAPLKEILAGVIDGFVILEAKYTYSVKPRLDGSPVQVSPSPFSSWLYSWIVIVPSLLIAL